MKKEDFKKSIVQFETNPKTINRYMMFFDTVVHAFSAETKISRVEIESAVNEAMKVLKSNNVITLLTSFDAVNSLNENDLCKILGCDKTFVVCVSPFYGIFLTTQDSKLEEYKNDSYPIYSKYIHHLRHTKNSLVVFGSSDIWKVIQTGVFYIG